jgi:hypothetical protein
MLKNTALFAALANHVIFTQYTNSNKTELLTIKIIASCIELNLK